MLPGSRSEVVNFDSKRFAEGKTLPETGLCPVEDCNNRVPAAACRRGQPKRFAEGKTLPETGLSPVEDCNNRVPAAACRRG